MIEVVERTASDLHWPFEKAAEPYYLCGKPHGHRTVVDPCPAYPHDTAAITTYLHLAAECFPVGWPVTGYVLHHECPSRTNGWAQTGDYDYHARDERGHYKRYPSVVFPAKRIPIHPAMTRYVATHEYGHVVEAWIVYSRTDATKDGARFEESEKALWDEYAALRGMEHNGRANYGGGTWHANLGELFANDFRILICRAEEEYWPHPGIPRPEDVPGLKKWWRSAKSRYAYAALTNEPLEGAGDGQPANATDSATPAPKE